MDIDGSILFRKVHLCYGRCEFFTLALNKGGSVSQDQTIYVVKKLELLIDSDKDLEVLREG